MYFLAGVIGIFWVAAFLYFVHEQPESHPRISEEESIYLRRTIIKTEHIMPVRITVIKEEQNPDNWFEHVFYSRLNMVG